jgi:hypothetical protein
MIAVSPLFLEETKDWSRIQNLIKTNEATNTTHATKIMVLKHVPPYKSACSILGSGL